MALPECIQRVINAGKDEAGLFELYRYEQRLQRANDKWPVSRCIKVGGELFYVTDKQHVAQPKGKR